MSMFKKFLTDESGMETVEWAVLAALILAATIGVITALGGNVLGAFTRLEQATQAGASGT